MAVRKPRESRGDTTPGGNLTQAFVDLIDAGNAQAQLLLKAIAQHADWRTGTCYPKVITLAEISKCSPKTVRRYLHQMADDGLLKLDERHLDDGSQTSSLITLIGYEDWAAAVRSGGTVAPPRVVKKYDCHPGHVDQAPPGQVDQGGHGHSDQVPPGRPVQGPVDNLANAPGHVLTSPPGQQVSTREPSLELLVEPDSPPPPRKKRGAGESDLVDELRKDRPHCGRAIDKLIAPLLARIRYDAPKPLHSLTVIAEWAEKQTDAVLAEALRLLTEPGKFYRRVNCKPSDIEDALREAIQIEKGRHALRNGKLLFRGTPEFDEAIAAVAARNPNEAELMRGKDFVPRARVSEITGAKA